MYILLGTTDYYSSSSSSSSSYVYIQNSFFSDSGNVTPPFTSQRKTTERYHPPIREFLVRLAALLLQTHAKDLRFLGFALRFGRVSDDG